jgi:DNA-binding transcriptional regulator YhcF (GntR family)
MSSSRNGLERDAERPVATGSDAGHELDIERDSDVPISTQIYWQLAYQIESGRLEPGTRLPPVRELGAAIRVNPNTIRAVYRRLSEAGFVVGRHGAGTHVVDRPPVRRGSDALAGIVAETLRRAGQLGFSPDEVAQATFNAATARRRPGPLVHVLFAECTAADATFDAERIVEAFPDRVAASGVLLEEIEERLDRYHYDLVATTTFHADEAKAVVKGRLPLVAMLVGPAYMSLVHEVGALPAGARVGLVCGSQRGVENIAEVLETAGATGVEIIPAVAHTEAELDAVDRSADLVLLSREAIALGLEHRFSRPERLREWSYEFDPAGLELLRRAVERVDAGRALPPVDAAEGRVDATGSAGASVP